MICKSSCLLLCVTGLLSSAGMCGHVAAEDWGTYSIIPASAPKLVLEAIGSGDTDGTIVSIGIPTNAANQKWVVHPNADGSRVTGVCLGGKDGDTLFAFCGNRIWKRKIQQQHAMGAFSPWTKVSGTKL